MALSNPFLSGGDKAPSAQSKHADEKVKRKPAVERLLAGRINHHRLAPLPYF